MAQTTVNLKGVNALLVDSDHFTRGLIAQFLRGFGITAPIQVDNGAQAKEYLLSHAVDLCVMEASLPDMTGVELLSWLRRLDKGPARFIPVIVLSGYTQLPLVRAVRDAGASNVVRKPVSPQGLFDRIAWAAKNTRAFIEAPGYTGPDRRFQNIDPPHSTYRRETDDVAQVNQFPRSAAAAAIPQGFHP